MDTRIGMIEIEGSPALGFDTGLGPAAFAQARLAQLLTDSGALVGPDGRVELWQSRGVREADGRMVVWGPAFSGVGLDQLIEADPDQGLTALGRALEAKVRLDASGLVQLPFYPGGVLLGADGTVFFPPYRLMVRILEAEGAGSRLRALDRWLHPERGGAEAEAFTCAALAYRLLCGVAPFAVPDLPEPAAGDLLRRDIRDGFFLPARLAEPGLDPALADLLDRSLGTAAPADRAVPSLAELTAALNLTEAGGIRRLVRPVAPAVREKVQTERIRYEKNRVARLGRRRFFRRNKTVFAIGAAAILIVGLFGFNLIQARSQRPTTRGLSPREVTEAYYRSFNTLDHTFMDACVDGRTGAQDIEAVMNLFVISRVREAYERKSTVLSAEQWLAEGAPRVDASVFGVSSLDIEDLETDPSDGEVAYRSRYTFWYPASVESGTEATTPAPATPTPSSTRRIDTVRLKLKNDRWRITAIDRRAEE